MSISGEVLSEQEVSTIELYELRRKTISDGVLRLIKSYRHLRLRNYELEAQLETAWKAANDLEAQLTDYAFRLKEREEELEAAQMTIQERSEIN